jgi:hypothetical protein
MTTSFRSRRRGISLALLLAAAAIAGASESSCPEAIYVAFDSRLAPRSHGRVKTGSDRVTGFEIASGIPIVTFEHRVVALNGRKAAGFPVLDRVLGATVDSRGELRFDTQRGVLRRGEKRLVADTALSSVTAGRLLNSGTDVFVEVIPEKEATLFVARGSTGDALPIAKIAGAFRAASWNELGLAAIVGDTVYVWRPGANEITALAHDYGFRAASDVCLIAPDRAVVATAHAAVVVTASTQLMLVGFPARVRFSGGRLYLLDARSGIVWSTDRLELLGDAAKDRLHARMLVSRMKPNDPETSVHFLEAARIVGCREVRRLRQEILELP